MALYPQRGRLLQLILDLLWDSKKRHRVVDGPGRRNLPGRVTMDATFGSWLPVVERVVLYSVAAVGSLT